MIILSPRSCGALSYTSVNRDTCNPILAIQRLVRGEKNFACAFDKRRRATALEQNPRKAKMGRRGTRSRARNQATAAPRDGKRASRRRGQAKLYESENTPARDGSSLTLPRKHSHPLRKHGSKMYLVLLLLSLSSPALMYAILRQLYSFFTPPCFGVSDNEVVVGKKQE
ncbi:hypothetical protein QAD02_010437 [Eretmocerus hayati]|uniref:Uncharacterized protein n=1 Tax=Eretmocerus hayati TaxID=131215 RepID=A0ACC2NVM0_9HYME|nr:hypothetical protein QAD02_010437 [Eretmocerus hayati]